VIVMPKSMPAAPRRYLIVMRNPLPAAPHVERRRYVIVVPRSMTAPPRRYLIVVPRPMPAAARRYLIMVPRPLPAAALAVHRRYWIVAPGRCPRARRSSTEPSMPAEWMPKTPISRQGFQVCQSFGGATDSGMGTREKPIAAARSRCQRLVAAISEYA
jgi:hypothetical protein